MSLPFMLYIDPGTGSMLFSIIIGVFGVLVFFFRSLLIKLKFRFNAGAASKADTDTLPVVIFSDHKRYFVQFKPILDEFEKRGFTVYYYTASPDDPALSEDYKTVKCEFIGEGNKAISKMNLISAVIVFSTTPSLDVYQWKRSKSVKYYVHIPHASSDITLYKMFGLDFYDSVLLSGDYQIEQIRKLEEIRKIKKKELTKVGIPYMDVMLKRLSEDKTPVTKERPLILLAPSWGSSSIFNTYGTGFIDRLIETGYDIVIRPHPQSFTAEADLMDMLMRKYPDLEWNRDQDNYEILKRADVLISDFSGVLFDFSLVYDKPVIYSDTTFDPAPYDAGWLDEPLWTFTTLGKIGIKLTKDNADDISKLIDRCLDPEMSSSLKQARDKARAETWYDIGSGAKNTADYIIAKYKELTSEKTDDKKE